MIFWIVLSISLIARTLAHSAEEWRERSIYQIITDRFALSTEQDEQTAGPCIPENSKYCGGTFKGIQRKLQYIKDLGFNAIWISPVVSNVDDGYHGYWANDLNSINKHFGSEQDLKDLIKTCHDNDIWVMLDVTVNNMAAKGPVKDIDYGSMKPFNKESYYHPYCPMNYSDLHSQYYCWLGDDKVPLPDLDTSSKYVMQTFDKWVKSIRSNYDFDGIRIDALKHVQKEFFPSFVKSSGTFAIGEYFTGSPELSCDYMQDGVDAIFNFPTYFQVVNSFNTSKFDITWEKQEEMRKDCLDTTVLGNIMENHDLPRFASVTDDQAKAINFMSYIFLWEGIPIIYYGTEHHLRGHKDPFNREALWETNYNLDQPYAAAVIANNAFRKHVIKNDPDYVKQLVKKIDADNVHTTFSRGDVVAILGNWGTKVNISYNLDSTNYSPGSTVIDLVTQETFKVGSGGSISNIVIKNGYPRIFYPSSKFDLNLPKFNMTIEPKAAFIPATTVYTSVVKVDYPNKNSSSAFLTQAPLIFTFLVTGTLALLSVTLFMGAFA